MVPGPSSGQPLAAVPQPEETTEWVIIGAEQQWQPPKTLAAVPLPVADEGPPHRSYNCRCCCPRRAAIAGCRCRCYRALIIAIAAAIATAALPCHLSVTLPGPFDGRQPLAAVKAAGLAVAEPVQPARWRTRRPLSPRPAQPPPPKLRQGQLPAAAPEPSGEQPVAAELGGQPLAAAAALPTPAPAETTSKIAGELQPPQPPPPLGPPGGQPLAVEPQRVEVPTPSGGQPLAAALPSPLPVPVPAVPPQPMQPPPSPGVAPGPCVAKPLAAGPDIARVAAAEPQQAAAVPWQPWSPPDGQSLAAVPAAVAWQPWSPPDGQSLAAVPAAVAWQPRSPPDGQSLAAVPEPEPAAATARASATFAAAVEQVPPPPPDARPLPPIPGPPPLAAAGEPSAAELGGQPLAVEVTVTRSHPPQWKRTDFAYRRFARVLEQPQWWWNNKAVMLEKEIVCFDVCWETYHGGWRGGREDENLVVHMHRRGLEARHDMQRLIEAGSSIPLLRELPAVGGTGEPIRNADFAGLWGSNASLLLLHLTRKHEGESREVCGDWQWRPGRLPTPEEDPCMHHAQFGKTRAQYLACLGKGAAAGKGQAGQHPPGWQPAVGGKGGDGDGGKGQGQPAVSGAANTGKLNRVLYQAEEADGFWFRTAYVYTLPQLLRTFSTRFSARDLYTLYTHSRIFTVKRPHAWSSEPRRQAALTRYAEAGRYGFPRRG